MMKSTMNEIESADAVGGPVGSEGGRAPCPRTTGKGELHPVSMDSHLSDRRPA